MLLMKTTCGTKKEAERICRALVEEGIAACASCHPCVSFFFWEGKLQKQAEYLVELKIRDGACQKAGRRIKALHPYSLPQIIALRVAKSSREYARWVGKIGRA